MIKTICVSIVVINKIYAVGNCQAVICSQPVPATWRMGSGASNTHQSNWQQPPPPTRAVERSHRPYQPNPTRPLGPPLYQPYQAPPPYTTPIAHSPHFQNQPNTPNQPYLPHFPNPSPQPAPNIYPSLSNVDSYEADSRHEIGWSSSAMDSGRYNQPHHQSRHNSDSPSPSSSDTGEWCHWLAWHIDQWHMDTQANQHLFCSVRYKGTRYFVIL